MTTNPLTDYMLHLVDVACEGPTSRDPVAEPNIPAPATFIADTLRALGSQGVLITRTGTERAADILFTHPDVKAMFRIDPHRYPPPTGHTWDPHAVDPTAALRAIIYGEILPSPDTTENFRNHWNYIIGPALDEHCAVARISSRSEESYALPPR